MIDVVTREVATAAPFGEAAGCPIIFASREAMLRVINYSLPTRLRDEETGRQPTMTGLNIGHGDHVAIDAVAALLEGEHPVPTIKRTYASAFGCDSFNRRHFAYWRFTGGTPLRFGFLYHWLVRALKGP
jgi:hypothetical protein